MRRNDGAAARVADAHRTRGSFDIPESSSDETPVLPQRLIKELHRAVPSGATITRDAGENRLFMMHHFQTKPGVEYLQPSAVGGPDWRYLPPGSYTRPLGDREDPMAQKISGGCACGAVRYETTADPVLMVNCHCRDCQQAGGSNYAPIMVVPKSAVKLSGELRYYRIVGNGGKAVERGFCPSCGCQIAVKLERLPDVLGFQAGSLDDPSLYKPAMDIFTARAQPWDHLHPDTKKLEQGLAG